MRRGVRVPPTARKGGLKAVAAIALLPLTSLLALSLAGCGAVGPDYKIPDQALIKQPLAAGPLVEQSALPSATQNATPAATAAAVPDDWWQLYDDPVLNGLIRDALASNADLRMAQANLEKAQAVLDVAAAQGGFSGAVSGALQREQVAGQAYLLTEKPPVANITDLGIAVSYQFDFFGVLRRGVEAAGADVDAQRAAGDVVRITVVANVARAYIDNCAAAEEEDIAQQSLALQRQSAELQRRLRDAGRGAEPNVTRSVTQVETLRASLPLFAARRRTAHYTLAALLARAPADLPAKLDECRRTPRIEHALPVGDGAALLRRRPDVREAERRLASSTARIGVAIGELYPNISFGASTGLTGISGQLGEPSTQRWGFGPIINWTIPANGARGRIRVANADARAALAKFDSVVLNALREAESSLSVYSGDLGRMDALHDAQRSATESAAQTHRFYLAGRESFLSDLDATRTLISVNAQVAEAEGKVAQDQVAVFLALGGGWQEKH